MFVFHMFCVLFVTNPNVGIINMKNLSSSRKYMQKYTSTYSLRKLLCILMVLLKVWKSLCSHFINESTVSHNTFDTFVILSSVDWLLCNVTAGLTFLCPWCEYTKILLTFWPETMFRLEYTVCIHYGLKRTVFQHFPKQRNQLHTPHGMLGNHFKQLVQHDPIVLCGKANQWMLSLKMNKMKMLHMFSPVLLPSHGTTDTFEVAVKMTAQRCNYFTMWQEERPWIGHEKKVEVL